MTAATTMPESRIDRLSKVLAEEGVTALLAAPSSDLVYLAGYAASPSERPTLLAVVRGAVPTLLLPELEAPRVRDRTELSVVTYGETDSPYVRLREALPSLSTAGTIAISDGAWARVLLALQSTFPAATFVSTSPLLRRLRMRKEPKELDLLREAARRADAAFAAIEQLRFAGRTEREIAQELTTLLGEQGLEQATWGPIVAGGPNAASPHHMTGERAIHEGDSVVLDFGGVFEGYQADITRTVHVSTPDAEFREVYDTVLEAQQAGVDASLAGIPAEEVDRATRAVIDGAGYGEYFVHRTGHGIGLDEHEEPYIVHGNKIQLEPGMTFSIEPGIYIPGKLGVRIEDIVSITAAGPQRLNRASRELAIVH